MKIDMHCHASERSLCSNATEREQIEAAIQYGLGGVVITDHDVFMPKEHLARLNEEYAPFRIFSGIEIRTKDSGEDVLVIGVHEDRLQQKRWGYEELFKFVREKRGYMAVAHPFRYSDQVIINVDEYVPDAFEVHSMHTGRCDEGKITAMAERIGARLIGNSDAHNTVHMGIYYNEFSQNIHTNEELVEQLKQGNYTIGCDQNRIDLYNQEVREREALIRQMILEGKTASDYERLTGNWSGQFDKVMMGRSYEI